MGPFKNRVLQVVPMIEEPQGVVMPPSPRVAQRSAGVPILSPVAAPQSLRATADFTPRGQGSREAYWMIGRDLFQAQSNQILRDARSAIQVPSDSPFLYPSGIFQRLQAAALRRNPGVTLPPLPPDADNTSFSEDWMKVLLWLTYSDAPTRLNSVRLPTQNILPETGDADWTAPGPVGSSSVAVTRGFDPALLAQNPFAVYFGENLDVEPERDVPDSSSSSSSSSGGLLLVGVGLAALLLLGGRK
jgi:hypothetical protein